MFNNSGMLAYSHWRLGCTVFAITSHLHLLFQIYLCVESIYV